MSQYLLLAAMGGVIWSIVIILDRIAVNNIFKHPLQALIVTCFMGTGGFLVLPFIDFSTPTINSIILAFIAGAFLWLSYVPYYYALNIGDDATEVAVWDAAHPMLIALFAIPLGLILSIQNWVGVTLICLCIIGFQWSKAPSVLSVGIWKYRLLLIMNATAMALTYLLMGFVLKDNNYWDVYPFYLAGTTSGIIMLLYKPVFTAFRESWRSLVPYWWLFIIMETCNVIAPILITFSMIKIHPAVASALGATFPIYITLAGPILRKLGAKEELFPKIEHIGTRVIILIILSFSIGLLYNPQI